MARQISLNVAQSATKVMCLYIAASRKSLSIMTGAAKFWIAIRELDNIHKFWWGCQIVNPDKPTPTRKPLVEDLNGTRLEVP